MSAPDGGWGWVVVFSSFMIHVIADGVTYTIGIFYVEFLHYYHSSKGTTAWVASIMVGTTFCIGPFASALMNKYGCRKVAMSGALIASLALLISTLAPNVLFLFFSIGLGAGLGFGLMYVPAIVCVTCYFEKKRAFATGIAVCGSGFGTFAMAPLTELLVESYGWKGAMTVVSGLVLNCLIFGALFRPLQESSLEKKDPESANGTIMNRLPPRSSSDAAYVERPLIKKLPSSVQELRTRRSSSPGLLLRKDVFYSGSIKNICSREEVQLPEKKSFCSEMKEVLDKMLDTSLLREPVFLLFGISNFFTNIGFNVPFVYTKDRALGMGIAADKEASNLLAIIGIANTAGRIVLGYLSDKSWVNRLYLYNLCLTLCGLATALSAFCTTYTLMALYAALFGITAGAYVSLTSVILVDLLGLEKLTNAFGLLLFFEGVACLVGPPITGFLYDGFGSYDPGFYVCGLMISLSGLMLFAIPFIKRKTQNSVSNSILT